MKLLINSKGGKTFTISVKQLLRRYIMEAITLEDVVRVVGPNLEEDSNLLQYYDVVVKVLKLIFKNKDIEAAFQYKFSKEEVVEYAKKMILSVVLSSDDIHKIEIISDDPKKLLIEANGHFDPDESFSCRDAESMIKKKIKIFTGYDVEISL